MTLDLTDLVPGAIATLRIAFGAWLLAVVVGLLMTYIREVHFRPLLWLVNGLTTVIRAIPELVLLYLVYFGVAYTGVRLESLTAAIIALGVVVRGETAHFDHICHAAATGISAVGLETGVPCAFGVLTTEDMDQAVARAGGDKGNAGSDAADAAVVMTNLLAAPG